MTTYRTIAWKEGRIWSVTAPSIPGLFGTGKTEAAARRDFEAALHTMHEYLTDIGEPMPKPEPVHVGSVRLPTLRKAS